ncbi:flagellar basal-body MS-ring/collar protein FliF [Rhodoferax fermentans]|uniref:Flagellar M-ring protein n=1 Tax=Rhodoferax fermentans TaxID=28066 RepID=A0A1T1AX89_RHOFE|nr:flagellar basal-body MS-ring/collar protein FliF [Rhodoferax fermentans]MBK1683818.1 flagellar basal body M-ring protein FliF [Rhodoferax fermentans]OOV08746.1 flagellar M-ring protein FliF [Rhodoferax fermentans]
MPAATALPAISVNPSFSQRLAMLDQGQKMRLAVGVVLFVMIGVVGLVMGRQAEWRVLYANLADKDGGAIVAQLTTLNVPYKYAEGGGAILVPADKVYDTRLKMASLGLPKGAITGFELMDTANRFGMTQFQERLTFQRGLEGELTRSIQALSSVQSARVHLALPNQNGFFREQQKPSASVVVGMNAGRSLDRAQLAGIIHLVSSSVPEMDPKAVSVLDDTGKLLSATPEGELGMGADAQQLQHVQQIEQLYSKRILDILEPVVGRQNVRAQVTAELDFSQTESTSELFKPNQTTDAAAIRSQQLLESTNAAANALPTGVPGAVTNQPPGPTAAPINGAAQTPAAANGANAAAGTGGRKESIINYEVDKTIRVVRGSTGMIKRISAAVVLNHQTTTDAKGKTSTVPLTDAQLEKMTALVRETIGFSADRGDSVNVVNAPFTLDKVSIDDVPLWQQPQVQDLARSLAWPLGTLLFAALVLMGAIRPALKVMAQPMQELKTPSAGGLDAIESDEPDRPMLAGPAAAGLLSNEPSASDLALEEARKLTRDNPAAVANIVKTWINGEAPA